MKSSRLIAEAMLRLVSAPVVCAELWQPRGVRHFLRQWLCGAPGSLDELQVILGMFDAEVEVRWLGRGMLLPSVTRGGRGIFFGVWPGPRSGEITVTWSAPELLAQAVRLEQAVEAIIAWWTPIGVSVTSWSFGWRGAALAVSPPSRTTAQEVIPMSDDVQRAMRYFARRILGVTRRRTQPAETHIALFPDRAVTIKAGRLAIGTKGVGEFMVNAEEVCPRWQVKDESFGIGTATIRLTAVGPTSRLDVLSPPGCSEAEWLLNGRHVVPDAGLEFTPSFLVGKVMRGTTVELTLRADPTTPAAGETLWVYPNPARFVAARFDEEQHRYIPTTTAAGGDPPGTFIQFATQSRGLSAVVQPLPVTARRPAETESEWLGRAGAVLRGRLVCRTDIKAFVRSQLGQAAAETVSVDVSEESWLVGSEPPRFVQGTSVRIVGVGATPEARQGLTARLTAELNRMMPPGQAARVEVPS
jgi:hypothetical protein